MVKNLLTMQYTQVPSLVWEDPHAAGQLSPCATATVPASRAQEPHLLKPTLPNKRGRRSDKSMHPQTEGPPLAATREKPKPR